jgi:hypothetical protein
MRERMRLVVHGEVYVSRQRRGNDRYCSDASLLTWYVFRHTRGSSKEEDILATILIVILLLMLVGALPRWNHSRNWGYRPSGSFGVLLAFVLILLLAGRL